MLTDFGNVEAGKHPCRRTDFFQRILDVKSVHNRSQHSDMIGNGAVHPLGSLFGAAENVAAADNDADLHAAIVYGLYLFCQTFDDVSRHTETFVAHQSFAGKLEQNSFINRFHYGLLHINFFNITEFKRFVTKYLKVTLKNFVDENTANQIEGCQTGLKSL